MSFDGFDASAIRLLHKLPDFDASAYAAEKTRLKRGVLDPGGDLIEAVADALPRPLTVVKRSSVSPLHRDLRFAAKGTPRYKDHLLLTAWEGKDKKLSPVLWLRIDSEAVGFASGMGFDSKARERWRSAVGEKSGERLAKAIAKVESAGRKHFVEVAGDSLKQVPAPWPADHPRADLLRMNAFQIRFMEPLPNIFSKPTFAKWCTTRLTRLLPVHDWLVSQVAAAKGGT